MRKIIVIMMSCTLVLLLGYAGYRGFELWKQNHWMSLAKSFAARGDAHSEFLALEQVLNSNSRNVDACRMMADLAQAARSPSALTWRERVVELDPDSSLDHLALAQTAVLARNTATARKALDGVSAADKNTPAYFNVLGTLDVALDQPYQAQADFAQAARLDPSNPAPQLSLAVLQLHGTNSLDRQEARISLQRLSLISTNAGIANAAKRELVLDALQNGDDSTALSFSKSLVQQTNAPFSDKLLRLDVLRTSKNAEYRGALASYEKGAAGNSDEIYQMTMWLMQHNLPTTALNWLQSLSPNTQTNMPTALLVAQCQMLAKDWTGLQNSISKQNWGKLDFTREAYLSRALREQGLFDASKAEWDVAVHSANGADQALTSLFRLAAEWDWQDESQQLLWSIVNNYPQEKWAETDLASMLYQSGSTRPLMQLFGIEANRNPNDLDAKNNLALTAMLLRAQELNPYDLTRQVYQKAPTNSFYACTYAFSLYLQGKNAEALKIMQQLTPQDLKNNSTDGYYGVILKAAGDNSDANAYLARSVRGQLLPEERALFQHAMSGL